MKSKRFLTVLLSLAIMLTFMPSMAFAAQEGEYNEGHNFNILADESNVVWTAAPTCTTPGYGVVTCQKTHGGVQCKATKNVEEPALGHDPGDEITVTAAEFAAQMVKEGVPEKDAKTWLEGYGKQICTGKVNPCKNCGAYLRYNGEMATFSTFYNSYRSTEHVAPSGTLVCAATFDCEVCGQKGVSNSTYNATNSNAYHGINSDGTWTWGNGTNGYNSTFSGHFKVKDEYAVHKTVNSMTNTNEEVDVRVLECSQGCGLERKLYRMTGAFSIRDFDHNTVTETKEATCTEHGYTRNVCADCGYILSSQETAKLDHNYVEVTVSPADEEYGEKVAEVCTMCKGVKSGSEREVTLPLKHNITTTVIAPASCLDCTWILVQCTNPVCKAQKKAVYIKSKDQVEKIGSKYYFTFDGEKVEVPFEEATGHKWGDAQTIHEATCTEGAEEARVCTVCGAINHQTVREISKPLGHDVEEVVVAPTCGEAGYSYKICNRCTNYLSEDGKTVLGKTPADFEAAKYAPTNPVVKLGAKCNYEWQTLEEATPFKLGTRAKICTVCGHELAATKESIAKTKIAAPKVKAGKKKATVTVKAVEGAVKYQIKVNGKVKKTVTSAKKVTIKKLKGGKKAKFQIVAFNAEGVKAASKVKSVKIKK